MPFLLYHTIWTGTILIPIFTYVLFHTVPIFLIFGTAAFLCAVSAPAFASALGEAGKLRQ